MHVEPLTSPKFATLDRVGHSLKKITIILLGPILIIVVNTKFSTDQTLLNNLILLVANNYNMIMLHAKLRMLLSNDTFIPYKQGPGDAS